MPPDPIAIRSCSGSTTSPVPVIISDVRASACDEQRFEAAQRTVRAPVFGEFNGSSGQIAGVFFELLFEAFEQRECVRRRAGKSGEHAVFVQAADLCGHYLSTIRLTDRDLTVAADDDAVAAPDGQESWCLDIVPTLGFVARDVTRKSILGTRAVEFNRRQVGVQAPTRRCSDRASGSLRVASPRPTQMGRR